MSRMDHSGVNEHVVENEFGRPSRVRKDAAHGASDQEYVFRPIGFKPIVHSRLVAQVELLTSDRQNVRATLLVEGAADCRADETGVAGDIDSTRLKIHMTSHRAGMGPCGRST